MNVDKAFVPWFYTKKSFSLYFLDSTNILKTQITFGRYLKMSANY
jgi:hypothetical protein